MSTPYYNDVPFPSDPPECHCMELGAQVCSVYENWCSDVQTAEWYNALTQAERHELVTNPDPAWCPEPDLFNDEVIF